MIDYLNRELKKPRYLLTHTQTFSRNLDFFSHPETLLICECVCAARLVSMRCVMMNVLKRFFSHRCQRNIHSSFNVNTAFFGKCAPFMRTKCYVFMFNSLLRFTTNAVDYFYILQSSFAAIFLSNQTFLLENYRPSIFCWGHFL